METELKDSGQKSSLLKNQPSKYSLRKSGLALEEIPPLNVVLNPSVDTRARESGISLLPAVEGEGKDLNKGFKPGPFAEHSWVLERNKIPAYDYEHTKFAEYKGKDFNAIHKEREGLWKKTIVPLTDSERDNHLFRIPDDPKSLDYYQSLNLVLELKLRLMG
ncbi:hypothetical protein KUTeg_020715 [Tegillarca granosa]|uniref:Uncharacterized protein n=1 Tax=Tegillarca granosa TaxID=220873 RepID=A0ABQ9E8R2_TEGGR|nr:hypothetical protein KUTeg_020715 [Tegillarca granosa]